MKNNKILFAILAIMLVLVASCDFLGSGGGGGGGTEPTAPIAPTGPTNPTTPTPPAAQTFTSVAAFKTWLDAQANNAPNNPYSVALNISSLNGLKEVLLNASSKFVSLDLSGSTLTAIPDNAFYYIDIPANTSYGCVTLVAIILPNSVTSIGEQAFNLCYLASLNIPNKRKMTHFTQLQS